MGVEDARVGQLNGTIIAIVTFYYFSFDRIGERYFFDINKIVHNIVEKRRRILDDFGNLYSDY